MPKTIRSLREPFGNMHFRLEIDGCSDTGAIEVTFPEARLSAGPPQARIADYGILVVRRGLTESTEWYDWWDRTRRHLPDQSRGVTVVLLDRRGVDVRRWTYPASEPLAYLLSPLLALGNEPLVETLEIRVGGFDCLPAVPAPAPGNDPAKGQPPGPGSSAGSSAGKVQPPRPK